MTDEELIARLRDVYVDNRIRLTAADRIKALSQIVGEMHVLVPELRKKVSDTEAKLATAVVGLKFYTEKEDYEPQYVTLDCDCCSYMEDPIILDDKGHLARSVLAKIEKETK